MFVHVVFAMSSGYKRCDSYSIDKVSLQFVNSNLSSNVTSGTPTPTVSHFLTSYES